MFTMRASIDFTIHPMLIELHVQLSRYKHIYIRLESYLFMIIFNFWLHLPDRNWVRPGRIFLQLIFCYHLADKDRMEPDISRKMELETR